LGLNLVCATKSSGTRDADPYYFGAVELRAKKSIHFVNIFRRYDVEGRIRWGGESLPDCPGVRTRSKVWYGTR
jgi:hypothetical protein